MKHYLQTVSYTHLKYMTGFRTVAAMVEAMVEEMKITVPVALHLDHGSYAVSYTHLDVYKRQE